MKWSPNLIKGKKRRKIEKKLKAFTSDLEILINLNIKNVNIQNVKMQIYVNSEFKDYILKLENMFQRVTLNEFDSLNRKIGRQLILAMQQ